MNSRRTRWRSSISCRSGRGWRTGPIGSTSSRGRHAWYLAGGITGDGAVARGRWSEPHEIVIVNGVEMSKREHWERVYTEKRPDDVSWYQGDPALSLELIRSAGITPDARIIDVGGGASVLVDRLLVAGFTEIGVLDLSDAALCESRNRLGAAADWVEWIVADLLGYEPSHPWDLWHDRAVFHFLVDPEDRARYREALYRSVPVGGNVVVSTFGPEGPERCSGLDACRYPAEGLAEALGNGVELVESRLEDHTTPSGGSQQFVYVRLRRIEVSS